MMWLMTKYLNLCGYMASQKDVYKRQVYYDPSTQTYSNNKAASITSAAVTDIKTISDTKATATLKATGTPGAEVKFFLTSGEDERTLTLDEMFSKGTPLKESSSGNYEYTITDLTPDTEYHVRLMIKKAVSYTHLDVYKRQPDDAATCSSTCNRKEQISVCPRSEAMRSMVCRWCLMS